jgi:hypothetical protein
VARRLGVTAGIVLLGVGLLPARLRFAGGFEAHWESADGHAGERLHWVANYANHVLPAALGLLYALAAWRLRDRWYVAVGLAMGILGLLLHGGSWPLATSVTYALGSSPDVADGLPFLPLPGFLFGLFAIGAGLALVRRAPASGMARPLVALGAAALFASLVLLRISAPWADPIALALHADAIPARLLGGAQLFAALLAVVLGAMAATGELDGPRGEAARRVGRAGLALSVGLVSAALLILIAGHTNESGMAALLVATVYVARLLAPTLLLLLIFGDALASLVEVARGAPRPSP